MAGDAALDGAFHAPHADGPQSRLDGSQPRVISQFERGNWWKRSIRIWGLLSVFVLLMFRLDLQPAFFAPVVVRTPLWEVLVTTSNVMMAGGFLLFGYGVASFLRWQKREIPRSEHRQASLAPRTIDDYVPRWVQYLIYGATSPWAWDVALLFLVAVGSVVRAPNYMDRILGPSYRRTQSPALAQLLNRSKNFSE